MLSLNLTKGIPFCTFPISRRSCVLPYERNREPLFPVFKPKGIPASIYHDSVCQPCPRRSHQRGVQSICKECHFGQDRKDWFHTFWVAYWLINAAFTWHSIVLLQFSRRILSFSLSFLLTIFVRQMSYFVLVIYHIAFQFMHFTSINDSSCET